MSSAKQHSTIRSGWDILIGMRFPIVALILLLAAPAGAQERYFGYYDHAISSPSERSHLLEHRSYANVASNVRWWVESDWWIAEAAGLKVILPWPSEFFDGDQYFPGIDYDHALPWGRWMWYGNPGDTAVEWYYAVLRHRDQIVAFGLADERDCNYGTTFPNWTYASCAAMARKLEANASTIKAIWSDGEYSWRYETAIPCERFVVKEDGEPYCQGIVFALADAA